MKIFPNIWQRFKKEYTFPKAESVKKVAVFGFADAKPGEKIYKEAYDVAYALAKAGYIVVDGGGPGVMRAATEGAKAGGGQVIGVTLYPKDMTGFEGRDLKNNIDEEIKTTSYVERTLTLMREGQVYVIFNGATGTMSEFAMAWGLARLYFGNHRPLILYGGFWRKIMQVLKQNLLLRPAESRVYKIVASPEGVLKGIKDFEAEIQAGRYENLELDGTDKKQTVLS